MTVTVSGDWPQDIHDMHTKFGVREVVENFEPEKALKFLEFRLNFLQEELNEAQAALQQLRVARHSSSQLTEAGLLAEITRHSADVVDALIDLCVVAIGTLDAFQVDSHLAWARVHEKNMQKEPGIKPGRPNPLGLPDLIKPAGWTAPTHEDNIGLLKNLAKK